MTNRPAEGLPPARTLGTLNEYVYFGGKRIALLPSGSTSQYYVEDSLGSSRVITTNTGVVCYDADFYPFGGERTPYTNSCTQNVYKFEGKERDAETGNDDFGARYYSNRFGRWLSADWSNAPVPVPYANLSNPQTLNLYAMVSDDPESFADLDGHCIPWCTALIGAGAGFVGDIVYQKIKNPDKPINYKEAVGAAIAGGLTGAGAGLVGAPATLITLSGEATLATGSATGRVARKGHLSSPRAETIGGRDFPFSNDEKTAEGAPGSVWEPGSWVGFFSVRTRAEFSSLYASRSMGINPFPPPQ
jgi:RHS repeat-associated protein